MHTGLQMQTAGDLAGLRGTPFDALPAEMRRDCFGVSYVHLLLPEGGDLYLTRYGWPLAAHLMPQNWFNDKYYARAGQRLPGATGTVYRVPTRPINGHGIDVVVKFSRFAQEVPMEVATSISPTVSSDDIANARFNSPFEEFGLVMELRAGRFGPRGLVIRAQRPLAIYTPPERFDLWQLGRSPSRFVYHQILHQSDQANLGEPETIELDIRRDYVVIYSWVDGEDAEELLDHRAMTHQTFLELTPRVQEELALKGFRVLDNKPKHFILRRRHRDGLLCRSDRLVYGLVDFELLQRTSEHQLQFKASRRHTYWQIQQHRAEEPTPALPASLVATKLFGVDYIYGSAPNGGSVWVIGESAELFDFFLPDRWRRTPRLKLSSVNEVYSTRTRDNIYLVYRRSRVGEKPHVEPLIPGSQRMVEHGYNSPFEEFSIAETLRRSGVTTVYPRAIYRTGHHSEKSAHFVDDRRYTTYAHLRLADNPVEPLLSPFHDYYTVWGLWRGTDPGATAQEGGVIDLVQAREENMISKTDFDRLSAKCRQSLGVHGFAAATIQHTQFLLGRDDSGAAFRRDAGSDFELTFCIDAQRAMEHRLVNETLYRDLLTHQAERLGAAGFESLDLHGDHLLLTCGIDGVLRCDERGWPRVAHCNFGLIRRR